MSNSKLSRIRVAALILLVGAVVAAKFTSAQSSKFIPVQIYAVQHMGTNFNIPEFYVNGTWGSNVARTGDGGSVCCVMLPRKWREGIIVEIRWSVTDWSKENIQETDKGNYSSLVTEGKYKANVPLEKFSAPGAVYVHFFHGGKVRVLSSQLYPENPAHPIQTGDERAGDTATQGKDVTELFSADELKKLGDGK